METQSSRVSNFNLMLLGEHYAKPPIWLIIVSPVADELGQVYLDEASKAFVPLLAFFCDGMKYYYGIPVA